MRYIGLDVHKDNITACVLSDAGKVVFEKDFNLNLRFVVLQRCNHTDC